MSHLYLTPKIDDKNFNLNDFNSSKKNLINTNTKSPLIYTTQRSFKRTASTSNYYPTTPSLDISNSKNYDCKNKTKFMSPFFCNEKTKRIQSQIDWINNIVTKTTKNTLAGFKSFNNNNSFNKALNLNLKYQIKSRPRYRGFNYQENYNSIPCILTESKNFMKNLKKPKRVAPEYKNADSYEHFSFMNEMQNMKNNNIKHWKNEFELKFNEY